MNHSIFDNDFLVDDNRQDKYDNNDDDSLHRASLDTPTVYDPKDVEPKPLGTHGVEFETMIPPSLSPELKYIYGQDIIDLFSPVGKFGQDDDSYNFDDFTVESDAKPRARQFNEETSAQSGSIFQGEYYLSAFGSNDEYEDIEEGRSRRSWGQMFKAMVKYKELHGHCNVSSKSDTNGTIGQWIKRQRYQMKLFQKGKPTPMNRERMAKLESIGFVWSQHGVQWEERFQELSKLTESNKDSRFVVSHRSNPRLSLWVKRQRSQYNLGKMPSERFRRLEAIGFKWSTT